jgi:hypothetical protein
MPHRDGTLWHALGAAGGLEGRHLRGACASVELCGLETGTSLAARPETLRGASILLATRDQLTAAIALIELDGLARRIVLCPPGLPAEHLKAIAAVAESETVVTDDGAEADAMCRGWAASSHAARNSRLRRSTGATPGPPSGSS